MRACKFATATKALSSSLVRTPSMIQPLIYLAKNFARPAGLEPVTPAVHQIQYFHIGVDYIFTILFRVKVLRYLVSTVPLDDYHAGFPRYSHIHQ